jgi:hypothetical protein
MIKKLLILACATVVNLSYAQEENSHSTVLQDLDYTNIAQDYWGSRQGGWKATNQLKRLIHEVDTLSKKCSEEIKWVPKPGTIAPRASELVKYAWSLKSAQRKIDGGNRYRSCVDTTAIARKIQAEETQYE